MDIDLQKLSRKDTIKTYFCDGYSYLKIIKFVSKYHDISISLRQLHRILPKESGFIQEETALKHEWDIACFKIYVERL